MSPPDLDLVKEILKHFWYGPVIQTLAAGPLRYSKVAAAMGEQAGIRPGDGTISKTLKELRALGLVGRQPLPGTKRHAWALTETGVRIVDMLNNIDQTSRQRTLSTADGHDSAEMEARKVALPPRGEATPVSASSTASDATTPILSRIDTTVPHPARRYNYWLGGKDHFAADRASGDQIATLMPTVRQSVIENRNFQRRIVEYLVREAGIRQFLDIGTGIPAPDHPHDVAQKIDPTCRVAYVDNDPIVLAHARALLTSALEGATCYVEADLRESDKIVNDVEVRATVDFSQPLAVLLIAVLHFVDDDDATRSLSTLVKALPAGSYLAISHATWDHMSPDELDRARAEHATGRHGALWPRSREQIARFFASLELVTPGVVPIAEWHDGGEPQPRPPAKDIAIYGGLGQVR